MDEPAIHNHDYDCDYLVIGVNPSLSITSIAEYIMAQVSPRA